ncbi:hypothetical protein ABW21_db0204228 [Orbilia brochopaga]|nr:hypothetical protein ABW21_db0204228 [Drechslerella brochopaga]
MKSIKAEVTDTNNDEALNTAFSATKLKHTPIDINNAHGIKREHSPDADVDSADEHKPPISAKKQRRGRPSGTGGTSSFTKEQDAYIIQLRQEGKNNTVVHKMFEERFQTGSNPKRIENRYFAIKDECLLNEWEEGILMEAIEEIETDIASAIVKRFKELSKGKSVTKGYVIKKMKSRQVKSKA